MTGTDGPIVLAEGLRKRFGKKEALRGFDLSIARGTVCGLLGPNGAGKTTAIRVLATLLAPDSGRAEIAGYDVVKEAGKARHMIGMAGQYAALDEKLTGRENLVLFGRLSHIGESAVQKRADALLERFNLTEAAHRLVSNYSGGMRRRLDLITSLIVAPPVLFLDEPTTGLDPYSRNEIWATIRQLVADGTTVLLTTQYLTEADELADDITVVDNGKVIASGQPGELKAAISRRIDVVVEHQRFLPEAAAVMQRLTGASASIAAEIRTVSVSVVGGPNLPTIVRELDAAGVVAQDVSLREPTLDAVLLHLTGHGDMADELEPAGSAAE
ncbi:daunorubicin/doxorubicin resistance ABC transporter ATP-binding protein DrrA [Actinosynnema sp. ALI-1.44]|uniref:ATP-binding cassette domain-containing protein n=1 Tax=Actinosynnema sp. ALI-1.44 TaxID=1933779 RepID=UPI00097BD02D|nr:ATP-binding cassette domain-containing protein [Actinosynnema sp. ALI-1.44]ONI89643.1 daunorubicin/doxorubicin resistance ABC transporter ATP-binding protein DrrA [Actinosynnema sp. ALI-1.44]